MNTGLKKLLAVAMSVMMIGSAAAVIPSVAQDTGITASAANDEGTSVSGDYWDYIYYADGTAKITKWHTYHLVWNASHTESTEVKHTDYPTVPGYIDNFRVTSIGRGAFGTYYSESVRLPDGTYGPLTYSGARGVTLPETIRTIDQMAFFRDINLEYVVLPEGLESIGMEAFSGCEKLSGVTLPDSLSEIQGYAFAETAISSVHVKTSLQSWARAFESCLRLSDVTIDEGIKEIPNYAFNNCSALTEIKLPDSLETLGRFAFSNTSLKSVRIPETMTSLGGAFINCAELEDINIPDGVTALCPNEFNGCKSLENIVLPSGLTTIGSPYAFSETGIKTITIPAGVKEIPYGAFYQCDALESVSFEGKIKKIGDLAFANCKLLSSIFPSELNVTLGRGAFSNCPSFRTVIIGKNTYVSTDSGIGFCYNSETQTNEKIPGMKIYCYADSSGEEYAVSNEFDYELISEVTGIQLDKTEMEIEVGETDTLTATLLPGDSFDIITWSVTNKSIATVENGRITAVGAGVCTVYAKTSNGKKAGCTVTVIPQSLKNNSSLGSDTVYAGDKVNIYAAANGGTAPYTYAYYFKRSANTKWNKIGTEFGTASSAVFTPTAAAEYDIRVIIKDAEGTTAEKIMKLTVKDGLKNTSWVNAEKVQIGDDIRVTGGAEGGAGGYKYAFYFKRSTNTKWNKIGTEFGSATYGITVPKAAADYDMKVVVKDSSGAASEKIFTVTVVESLPLTNISYLNAYNVAVGKTVTAAGRFVGGTKPVTYEFYFKRSANTKWNKLSYGNEKGTYAKFTPTAAAEYDIKVIAVDSKGAKSEKVMKLSVNS